MRNFQYIEDVEAWLAPLSYNRFWREVEVYDIRLPFRGRCDENIACGRVDEGFVLQGLKYVAAIELSSQLNLERKPLEMPDRSMRA